MIGADGTNLGVLSREEALALAKPEEGLDLVEIAPQADPPVARVINYDKYRYQQEKTAKKERRAGKGSELKQIQISARAAKHDLETRLRKLEEFLRAGHQVEIQLRLRGREKSNKDWARIKINEFLAMITDEYKVISPPRFGGRGMIAQIVKK